MKAQPLTDATLDEIEQLAKSNEAETYRGALLALVGEVRRLRGIVLAGGGGAMQTKPTAGEFRS